LFLSSRCTSLFRFYGLLWFRSMEQTSGCCQEDARYPFGYALPTKCKASTHAPGSLPRKTNSS